MTESQRGKLINDLQNNVNYVFNTWNPNIYVWRAGEGFERDLPYIAVDFVSRDDKNFPSMADIVGRIDDKRYEYAYCELEMIVVTIYANKYHNSGTITGRDFADENIQKIRRRILAYWNNILFDFNASLERGKGFPIRDLSAMRDDVRTRVHEFQLTFFLRTDVRWYRDLDIGEDAEERADKAYITKLNENINLRVEFNG